MALTKVRRGGTDTGISDASDATAITIDSSENVGIGESSPSSDLVVKQSGSTFSTASQTVALFQRNSTTGHGCKVTILSGNNTSGDLNFGDAEDEDIGRVRYEHNNNAMTFTTNGTEQFRIENGGQIDATCLYAHTTEYSGSMDDLKRTGFYRSNNGNTNNPTYAYYAVIVYGNQSNVTSQIATVLGGTTTYVRSFNTSWSSWARLDT